MIDFTEYYQIRTYCDAVKVLTNLYTILGLEFWFVYFEIWYRDGTPSTFYTAKEPCDEVSAGMGDKFHVALIVNDPIDLIIEKQNYYFIIKEDSN